MKTVSPTAPKAPRSGSRVHNVPFDWRIYADATCAGLSRLIPLPFVDRAVESVFRRRMPRAVCRVRGVKADPAMLSALGRLEPWLTTRGCLLFPIALTLYLLKRLSRKIFYFLTLHEAANALSAYWHRAFLLDHLARAGHLSANSPAKVILPSFDQTLAEANTSALSHIGRQVTQGARHVLRTLHKALKRGADRVLLAQASFLEDQWGAIAVQLAKVTQRYDQIHAAAATASSFAESPE